MTKIRHPKNIVRHEDCLLVTEILESIIDMTMRYTDEMMMRMVRQKVAKAISILRKAKREGG